MAARFVFAATVLTVAAAAVGEAPQAAAHAAALRGADVILANAPENATIQSILTPPNETHPLDALMAFRHLLDRQLRSEHYQWLVTAITFVFGAAMLVSPKGSFQNIFIAIIFAVTYTIAMADIQDRHLREHPDDESGVHTWEIVLALEIATGTSVVAWKGMDGLEYCIAIALGIYPLQLIQTCLVQSHLLGNSPYLNIIVLTASVAIGIFLMENHRLEQLLSYVLPVLGGRLVSASCGWFVFYGFEHTWQKAWLDFWHSLPLDVNDPATPDLQQALIGAPEVGWSTPTGVGPKWAGAVLGSVIWLALAAVGVWYHHRAVAQKKVTSTSQASQARQILLRQAQKKTVR